jgi:hypothetical protein
MANAFEAQFWERLEQQNDASGDANLPDGRPISGGTAPLEWKEHKQALPLQQDHPKTKKRMACIRRSSMYRRGS